MKAGFAYFLAQILLCQSQTAQKPCGECPACRRCLSGRHGNLLRLSLMDGAKTIKIEQLRSLISALSLHPLEAGPRVAVISGMHMMTVQAQNALLKSLEEPLDHDYYLLTCDNERAVLPTIISRCSMVRLPALEDDKIADLLRRSGCGDDRQTSSPDCQTAVRVLLCLSATTHPIGTRKRWLIRPFFQSESCQISPRPQVC